jgi:ATP-binding cassette subfamily C (CFTR/MRP) protein 1
LKAEETPQHLNVDSHARYAINCQGDFQYDVVDPKLDEEKPEETEKTIPSRPFKLAGIDLRIPQGELLQPAHSRVLRSAH